MTRAAMGAWLALVAGCSAGSPAAAPASHEAAGHEAAGTSAKAVATPAAGRARPQAAGPCTLTLTAPSAFTREATGSDSCTVSAAQGTVTPHDQFLFVARKAAPKGGMMPERSFTLGIAPTVAAGTTVNLTLIGQSQLTDQVTIGYDEGTVETRCNHFVGTAKVVAVRPNLDVTFDGTCQEPGSGAKGEHLAGELVSTL